MTELTPYIDSFKQQYPGEWQITDWYADFFHNKIVFEAWNQYGIGMEVTFDLDYRLKSAKLITRPSRSEIEAQELKEVIR